MYEIRDLKFKDILDIKQLTIDEQITFIVGASGSGKTTLLRHLNGLNKPDEGRIEYNGVDISKMNGIALRRRVVMLGQSPIIYDGTIGENLQIGLEFSQKPVAKENELLASLELVGLSKNLQDYCTTLSGGEKQRLCLARVMLMNAETYLMDEPSGSLDRETERFVIENLISFVRSKVKQLIIVTHSDAITQHHVGDIIHIEKGRVRWQR